MAVFEFGDTPLITARIALLPKAIASRLYAAADWKHEALVVFRTSELLRKAIIIASPSLYRELHRANPSERALRALGLFIVRMSTRATPFGLFAAVAMVHVREANQLRVAMESLQVRSRVDYGWLRNAVARQRAAGARSGGLLARNASVVRRSERLHAEKPRQALTSELFVGGSIKENALVNGILEKAATPLPAPELLSWLAAECGATIERAAALVDRLIESGALLTADVGHPLRDSYTACIEEIDNTREEGRRTIDAVDAVRQITAASSASEIAQALEKAAQAQPFERSPLQVDAKVQLSGALPPLVIEHAGKLLEILLRLAPRCESAARYRALFLERFEGTERAVPLTRFVGAAQREFEFASQEPARRDLAAKRFALLSRIVADAIANRTTAYDLREPELSEMLGEATGFVVPATFEFGFSVFGTSYDRIRQGDFSIAQAKLGGTARAGASVARFSDFMPESRSALVQFTDAAGDAERAAEIVFSPAVPEHLNVLTRDCTARWTIEDCVPGASNNALSLDRLYVTMRNERLCLWSEELERYVQPVQTNTYRTDLYGPSIARFLYALALDGYTIPTPFFWGSLGDLAFRPRLTHGRLILSRAVWTLEVGKCSDRQKLDEIDRFRRTYSLPRHFCVVDAENSDHVAGIDIDSELGRLLFLRTTKNQSRIALEEWLYPGNDNACVTSADGAHAAEFVASLRRSSLPNGSTAALTPPLILSTPRTAHPPLSEWTYVKWWACPDFGDRLMREARTLLSAIQESTFVSDWHVLRYYKPRHHLRVRFKTEDGGRALSTVVRFSEALRRKESIESFELSVYDPEYERYGGTQSVSSVERLFTLSSMLATDALLVPLSKDHRMSAALTSLWEVVHHFMSAEVIRHWIAAVTLKPRSLTQDERRWATLLRRHIMNTPSNHERSGFHGRPTSALAKLVIDVSHLHFNRFGLGTAGEESAMYVQRQAYRSLLAANTLRDEQCVTNA